MDNTHEIFSLLKISNRIKPATLKNVTDKSERALEKSKETRKHILHIYKSVQETKYSDVIMQQSEDIKEFLKSESDYLLDDMAKNYDFSLEDFNNLNRDLNEQINSMYNETSSGYGSANCNRTNTNLDDVDLERYKHSLKSLNEMIIMNKNLKKLQIIDMEECQNMKELEKKLTMYIKEVESLTKVCTSFYIKRFPGGRLR